MTVEVDDELVAQASAALGTPGGEPTVRRALEEAVARAARLRHIERLKTLEGLDLDNLEVMARAWR